jgi:prepilin peptidase CpaA
MIRLESIKMLSMTWLALGLLAIAAVCDLRSRIIPDWIALAMIALGLVGNALTHPVSAGSGLGLSMLGLALGAIVGLALFELAGLGGGDAKLIAGVGTAIGPLALFPALFWMAQAGAALAILASVRGRRELAYAPAIALGLLIHALLPGEFWRALASS